MILPLRPFSRTAKALLFALVASALPFAASAQQQEVKKEISDKISEEIEKMKPLRQDSKANADKILAEVTRLLGTVEKESYDRAVLLQLQAEAFFNKNEPAKAIAPLEEALQLADKYNLTPAPARLQSVQYLAGLYQAEGLNAKDPNLQKQFLDKAYQYAKRFVEGSKPNPDFQLFLAHILFTRASVNPDKVDMEILKQAQIETEKGLQMSIKPKDTFYVLLLATLQQQGDYARSADLLELLVKQFPNNKMYWQQLAATYLQLQQDLRAALTLERAHAQNPPILNEPAQNYNLVGIYYNLRQYDHAAQLLESWLRDGKVPPEQKNWELLATCYQQLHKEEKAITTLKEAATRFPKAGSIEQQIGQLYYAQDKFDEALKHLQIAVKKGIDKPAATYMFISYIAFELKKLEEALAAAEKAMQLEPNNKQAKNLLDAVKANVAEREAQKAAAIERAKKL